MCDNNKYDNYDDNKKNYCLNFIYIAVLIKRFLVLLE